ncbi:multicomponent Na+:H+ antiporter subunit F [Salinibacterium sp. CAN_S4]
MTNILYIAATILFVGAGLLALFRIVRGPSILDRMIASDVLLTTLMLVVGADMVINGHTRSIPVMLVLSVIAIFATVSVARYVSKQDRAITGVERQPGDPLSDGNPLSDRDPLAKGDS